MGRVRRVDLDVAAAYDRWACSYDSYDNPIVFMARAALAALIPDVSDLTIIEFGCGTGRNLAALREAGAGRLIGLDLSEAMLSEARNAVAAELVRHDMTAPAPFKDGCVDGALFCLSLEHIADLRRPLRDAVRLMKQDGLAWIVEIHPFLSLGGAKAHFRDGEVEVHMPTFPHRFSDYLAAFGDAGLRVESCLELRPADVAGELPPKVLKRGAETPLVVGFALRKANAPARA